MTGNLIPPGWKFYEVTSSELAIVSIVWGFTLGWSVFASGTAIRQTLQTRKRKKRITTYIAMVWAELIASFIIGFFSWFFMMGMIPPSFEFFFFVLVFWVIQIQVILQIIVNRVGLLLPDKRLVRNMKWTVAVYVGIINVSVFCIWLPAQLQRSETYVRVNHVWDRVTKALFLIVDAALNWYFLYMVRRDLIANGLHKYTKLFWTNATMAIVSVFMDVVIILSMFFKNPFVYVQFHPLAYQIKLSIEMSLADLIARVVRASHDITETSGPTDDWRDTRLTVDGPGPSRCSVGADGGEPREVEQEGLNGRTGVPAVWHAENSSSGIVEMDSVQDFAPPWYEADEEVERRSMDRSSTRSLRIGRVIRSNSSK